jgi:Uma2 family endonuclease
LSYHQGVTAPVRKTISVTEYLELEKRSGVRHEYVDGELHAMAGDKKRNNRIVGKVYRLLADLAEAKGCQVFFTVVKTQVAETRYRYPDVIVTCEEDTDEYTVKAPCALFEVLSETTEDIDATDKLEEYLKLLSLERYVMLRQDRPLAMVYKRTETGWAFEILDGDAEIDVPCLETNLKLDQVYAGITFG